jgi:hypothetical protein
VVKWIVIALNFLQLFQLSFDIFTHINFNKQQYTSAKIVIIITINNEKKIQTISDNSF